MEKLKVIIADDEQPAIEMLRNLLLDTRKVEIIQEVSNPLKIECAIQKHQPDALFLDIEMPGQNGLDLLRNIREYNLDLRVVYVTAFNKYVIDAIKLNVFSYLLKPVDRRELHELIKNLIAFSAKANPPEADKLKLPVKGGFVYLKPNDLLALEAEGNYTRIKTVLGEDYISSYNMGRLFDKLPKQSFFRVNRACVLNGELIYKINKTNNTCKIRVNNQESEFEVSGSFITAFNKLT